MLLLLPADPLRSRRVDEHFAPEAEAAQEAGIEVALVDHDALTSGASASNALAGVSPSTDAVYRGWMLTSEQYAGLVETAGRRGAALRTSASQYRTAHELPGWYDTFRTVTPEAVVARGFAREDLVGCLGQLGHGPAVLRDYVKSAKHYWHEAAFVPDVTDVDRAWTVARRFLDLRGEDRTGGFVLRRYEPFGPSEVRTWWIDGQCALVTAHPDTPDELPRRTSTCHHCHHSSPSYARPSSPSISLRFRTAGGESSSWATDRSATGRARPRRHCSSRRSAGNPSGSTFLVSRGLVGVPPNAATPRERPMRARRTLHALATGLSGLATVAAMATPAQAAQGIAVPGPPTLWSIDGDEATELGFNVTVDPPGDNERVCGLGRSAPVRTVNTIIVHVVVQACHTYLPEARRFTIVNRTYVCERTIGARECTPGITRTDTTFHPVGMTVEFRADGGNDLDINWDCLVDPEALRRGSAIYCSSDQALEGARGHRYNAWAQTFIRAQGGLQVESPISTSPERYVE